MTEVRVMDDKCWVCGQNKFLTVHHGIPKHLKPQKNVTVPICKYCHQKINADDVNGMYSYIYRLEKLLQETRNGMSKIANCLDKHQQQKEVRDKNEKTNMS